MARDFESELANKIESIHLTLSQIKEAKLKAIELSRRQAETAENSLTMMLKQFKNAKSTRESNAWLLPLSTSIFFYEFASAQYSSALASTDPARQIGLKNAAHKLYEFESMLSTTYRAKIVDIATSFNLEISQEHINSIRKTVAAALKPIKKLEHIRNVAGAHFDKNTAEYLAAVNSIKFDDISAAGLAMFKFCSEVQNEVIKILIDAKKQGAIEFSNTKKDQ